MTVAFSHRGWVLLVVLFVGVATGGLPAHAQDPLAPGASLPTIQGGLQRTDGSSVQLRQLTGSKGTVFLFWSNRCTWVDKYEERVQALIAAFEGSGIQFVRVNSNDETDWPTESLAACRKRAQARDYAVPYVRDSGAALARALGATRTPHVFVFDGSNVLVYAGSIDDSPADPERVRTPYLRRALEALLAGTDPSVSRTRAFGCTLKYPQ